MARQSANADRDEIGLRPEGAGERLRVSGPRKPAIPAVSIQLPATSGFLGPLTRSRSPGHFGAKTGSLWGLLLALTACAAVAHGCHVGDHGDADLVIQVVTAAESG